LQSRFHLESRAEIERLATTAPAAIVLFDVLADGPTILIDEPWSERRKRLRALLHRAPPGVRLSESSPNGTRMIARARRAGWEGIIAKRSAARYVPGARSRDWLKLKLQHRAEFVIGGFTEPRRTRPSLGAILLGYFDDAGRFVYVGHTGAGFTRESLRAMRRTLDAIEQREAPFVSAPRTNERAHWVKPRIVVEVKFAEWTADRKLRQPVFLGIRDDKDACEVHLESESLQRSMPAAAAARKRPARAHAAAKPRGRRRRPAAKAGSRTGSKKTAKGSSPRRGARELLTALGQLERERADGQLRVGTRATLHVSSLDKVFFPDSGYTKGDVMRYYTMVAPVLLPLLKDRPLILKRYPNGIAGSSFFQQNAGSDVPDAARVAEVATEDGSRAQRLVGGDLSTLLYTVQLGTIAVHPWQSRLPTIDFPDYSTIDLDPGAGVEFSRVVELASYIERTLDELGLSAALKTSGSRGLHIVLPLPTRTSYARSARLAEAIASRVVEEHPKLATLERRLQRRPRGTIYVDAQQNSRGKSVASAYSVREKPGAPVSAPLRWSELGTDLRIGDFTIATMPHRLQRIGDVWSEAMRRRNSARMVARLVGEG
jgi:bifunctional non-homologous end joining protein LigD